MVKNFLRYISTFFSFFFKNDLNSLSNIHSYVLKNLKKQLKNNPMHYSPRLRTHQVFNKIVYDLIINNNLINFLRNDNIQKIFFIHNRLFIINELNELRCDKKKWSLWKKLLVENNVGDPIRYFLYPLSSGNRIRQVYHLKKYSDYSKINYFKTNYILEIGGGYGIMAQILKKINKNCTYLIFDTMEVNFLQFYYLKMNKIPVVINKIRTGMVCLVNKISLLDQFNKIYGSRKSSLLIGNWSISEMPIKLRNNILNKTSMFYHSMIGFQEKFENIDNFKYFLNYKKKRENKLSTQIERLSHYKKSIINQNNHYYFFSKIK